MQSRTWLLSALALVSLMTAVAEAQVIPPGDLPGRERQRFIQPPAPQAQPAGPTVTLPSTVAPKGAEKVFLLVRGVKITGSTVYQPKDLAPLYKDLVGRRVSLAAVYALAQAITTKYGNEGYVLSRAVVPPQQLDPKGAIVQIEVVEGYIDKVAWPPQLSRYHDFFTDYAAKITAQRPANIRTIERYLLLAGDLPGLKFKTSLRPSKHNVGAATLVVEVAEKRVDLNAQLDNRGTSARGPIEYLGLVLKQLSQIYHDWEESCKRDSVRETRRVAFVNDSGATDASCETALSADGACFERAELAPLRGHGGWGVGPWRGERDGAGQRAGALDNLSWPVRHSLQHHRADGADTQARRRPQAQGLAISQAFGRPEEAGCAFHPRRSGQALVVDLAQPA